MELNPKSADAHTWYGWYLFFFNRDEEGLVEGNIAQQLDPLTPVYTAWVVWMYLNMGQIDDAIEKPRKALSLDPNLPDGKGAMEQAIAAYQKLVTVNPTGNSVWRQLAFGRGVIMMH